MFPLELVKLSCVLLLLNYVITLLLIPCHFVFVFVVLSGGGNMVAIDLIVQHVHSQLEEVRQVTLTGRHTYLHTQTHTLAHRMCHAGL